MIMKFGKYKGADVEDVPANYLLYLHENDIAKGDLKVYIQKNMAGILKQIADGNGDV
jgi:uncharacterized protein (DUF3820 family)